MDPSFSGDGKLTTDFTRRSDGAFGAALQADGKIIAVGWAGFGGGNPKFAVARYDTDGSLDTTFSGDGRLTTDFTPGDDEAVSVAIQMDGNIVVAGGANVSATNAKFAVARYNSDGSLDTTFSGDGKVMTNLTRRFDEATGVAIQADSKIVVAGGQNGATAWGADFAVVRYNTDGTLDTTFSGDGKIATDFSGRSFDFGQGGVQLQADGKIVVGGDSQPHLSNTAAFALARYNSDGTLDTTFSGDGKVTTSFGRDFNYVSGMAIQADGKIVACGQAQTDLTNPKAALARYNTDGTVDTTFSGDGKVLTDFTKTGPDGEFSVAVQADGKIVAAGEAGGANPRFAVVRYNTDGTLDTTFSGDGRAFTDFTGKSDFADFVLIQADGKIVAVGAAGRANQKLALARYLAA